MSNLDTIPLEDGFETTLAQAFDGQIGDMVVNTTPNFTFPVGATTYVVLSPGKANMQIAEINAYDAGLKTITVSNITLNKGAGIASTAQNHTVNSTVIISDNYEFWSKIQDAINSKLDNDGGNGSTTWDLTIQGSNFRIRKDGDDMKFTDDNNAEISLSTIAAAAGADTKVAISVNDTTPSQLEDKLIESDGITITKNNPAGNENFDIKVNINDTSIHSTESDFGLVKKATTAESLLGQDSSKYVSPDGLGISIEPELVTVTASNIINDTTVLSSEFTVATKTSCEYYGETFSNANDAGNRQNSLQVEISTVWTDVKVIIATGADDTEQQYQYVLQPGFNYRIRVTNTSSAGIDSNSGTVYYQPVI